MKHIFFLFIIIIIALTPAKLKAQIEKLSTGALLVRLETNEHLINYYQNNHSTEKTEKEKQKQIEKNQEIIQAFHDEWSLCPVYFFSSNYSHEIIQNDFTHVFDYNKQSLSTNTRNQLKNNFLITYIGDNPGTLKFHSLVLINNDFTRLKSPLPRYVRTYNGLWLFARKLTKTIKILEKKVQFHLSRIK